jgi:ribosome biogenesis GTPase
VRRASESVSDSTGIVLARVGGVYRVHTDAGEVTATIRGTLKHKDDDRIVPGDVVVLEGTTIAEIRPRRSVLARRAAQGSSGAGPRRAQPVAANVDQVIVVTSAADPEPSPRMIDRFLVIAEANGLPAAVVLNKIELDPAAEEVLARRFKTAGYQLLATSVRAEEGLAALRDLLRGRHSVFTGASGAGKSSLLNALEPGLKLRVGAISEKWRTGKHTTTAAELVPVAGVGYVVDTPGLREVGAWGIDPNELGACFPDFRPYLDQCRFDNCRHLAEPGCAVRGAPAGAIDPDRLVSYERIYEEVSEPSWTSGRRRGR